MPGGYRPVLVFLSDGCGGDATQMMTSIYYTYRHLDMYVHTIMFGSGGEQQLKAMANVAGQNGTYQIGHCNDLVSSFVSIAEHCSMQNALVGHCRNVIT